MYIHTYVATYTYVCTYSIKTYFLDDLVFGEDRGTGDWPMDVKLQVTIECRCMYNIPVTGFAKTLHLHTSHT